MRSVQSFGTISFERNDEKEREAHGMALFKFPKNKSAKQMFSVKV